MLSVYPRNQLNALIDRLLREDIGHGDITTAALISPDLKAKAVIVAKARGVIAGVEFARALFERLDGDLAWKARFEDGDLVERGDEVASIGGSASAILAGERTALNVMQRMSGIAAATAAYVAAIPPERDAIILDTRKTAPGLRLLDKYAVWLGGGRNHRFGLYDGVLIKDTHLALLRRRGLSIAQIISRARKHIPHTHKIEIEVDGAETAAEAAQAGADVIMLDNMSIADIQAALKRIGDKCAVEVSGGVDLNNIADIVNSGAQMISVGALTHSVKALDIALEFK